MVTAKPDDHGSCEDCEQQSHRRLRYQRRITIRGWGLIGAFLVSSLLWALIVWGVIALIG
jgi:hypothetical protein